MRYRVNPAMSGLGWAAMVFLALVPTGRASADVVGRVQVSVLDATDHKPIACAKVTLRDTANVRSDVTLTTDSKGRALSPLLENRVWQIVRVRYAMPSQLQIDGAQIRGARPGRILTDARDLNDQAVLVSADTTTDLTILVDQKNGKVVRIAGADGLLRNGDTADATYRDQAFFHDFPVQGSNPQSLRRVLRTIPRVLR